MMAVNTNKSWLIIYVLFFILMSISLASSQTEEKTGGQCVDGTYEHEGRRCCMCGVGLKVVEHCDKNLQHGKCEPCEHGTYSSHPNHETQCEFCTHCRHPNENLVEDEPCTAAKDAKCRCRQNHYCVSGSEICLLCHPCKECGAEGIKVKCAGNNNTVCNEIKDESQGGMIAGIIFGVVFGIAVCAGIAWYLWKRRCQTFEREKNGTGNGIDRDGELQHLNNVDLKPHIPDLAVVIGWKDVKRIAMRSRVPSTRIESCERDYQGDSEEQALQLLMIWLEHVGRGAPESLIKTLQQMGKKDKAERVAEILKTASSNPA